MLIQLLLLFITYALAEVHHECGLYVTRPVFTFDEIKIPPSIKVNFYTFNPVRFPLQGEIEEKLPLLIYKEDDLQFTNIPTDFDNKDSWGTFGVCTEEDIESKICLELNSFKVEYKQNDVSARIYNQIHVQKKPHNGYDLEHLNVIELYSFGKYCYAYYLTEDQEPNEDKHVSTTLRFNDYDIVDSISTILTSYYGRVIQLLCNIFLSLFIWFKKSKNVKKSIKPTSIQYQTPFIYCLMMLLVSSITSIIHLFLLRTDLKSFLIPYQEQNYLQRNNWNFSQILIVFESVFSLILYIFAYQFANLDKFGYKINYRKNIFTMILPIFMLLAFLLHYFDLSYMQSLVALFYRGKRTPEIIYDILEYASKIIEFSSFAIIWYIIYKISQDSSKEIAHTPDYANRFNRTRIWVVFSMILMEIFKIIFEEPLYNLVFIITDFIQNTFGYEESYGVLPNIVLFCLKLILCLVDQFLLFSLPVISIIILKIWWSYDPKLEKNSPIKLVTASII